MIAPFFFLYLTITTYLIPSASPIASPTFHPSPDMTEHASLSRAPISNERNRTRAISFFRKISPIKHPQTFEHTLPPISIAKEHRKINSQQPNQWALYGALTALAATTAGIGYFCGRKDQPPPPSHRFIPIVEGLSLLSWGLKLSGVLGGLGAMWYVKRQISEMFKSSYKVDDLIQQNHDIMQDLQKAHTDITTINKHIKALNTKVAEAEKHIGTLRVTMEDIDKILKGQMVDIEKLRENSQKMKIDIAKALPLIISVKQGVSSLNAASRAGSRVNSQANSPEHTPPAQSSPAEFKQDPSSSSKSQNPFSTNLGLLSQPTNIPLPKTPNSAPLSRPTHRKHQSWHLPSIFKKNPDPTA